MLSHLLLVPGLRLASQHKWGIPEQFPQDEAPPRRRPDSLLTAEQQDVTPEQQRRHPAPLEPSLLPREWKGSSFCPSTSQYSHSCKADGHGDSAGTEPALECSRHPPRAITHFNKVLTSTLLTKLFCCSRAPSAPSAAGALGAPDLGCWQELVLLQQDQSPAQLWFRIKQTLSHCQESAAPFLSGLY